MIKAEKLRYRKSFIGRLILMSSNALLMSTGVLASTVSISDMDKSMHHEAMNSYGDDGDDKDCCDMKDENGEHRYSPFDHDDKPYGMDKTGYEWMHDTSGQDNHSSHGDHGSHGDHNHDGHGDNDHVPFDLDPHGFERNGKEWRHDHGAAVPVPAAVWLFGSGLMGLIVVARRAAPENGS